MSSFSPKSLLERRLPQGVITSFVLAILGIVILDKFSLNLGMPKLLWFAILFLVFFVSLLRMIRLDEVAYVTLFGARIGDGNRRMEEGLHWLIPFSSLNKVDTQQKIIDVHGVAVNLVDGSRATVDLSVAYTPDIDQLHKFVGFKSRDHAIKTEVQAAIQQFGRTCSSFDDALQPATNGELRDFVDNWLRAQSKGKKFRLNLRKIEELGNNSQETETSWGINVGYVSIVNLDVPIEIRNVIEERERARLRMQTRKYIDAPMEAILEKLIHLGIPANQALDAAQILTNPDFGRTPAPVPPTLLMAGNPALGAVATSVVEEQPRKVGGKSASQPE